PIAGCMLVNGLVHMEHIDGVGLVGQRFISPHVDRLTVYPGVSVQIRSPAIVSGIVRHRVCLFAANGFPEPLVITGTHRTETSPLLLGDIVFVRFGKRFPGGWRKDFPSVIYAPFRKPIHSSERPDQYVLGFGYAAYILIVKMIAPRCVIWHR